jgi:hypothetical protein
MHRDNQRYAIRSTRGLCSKQFVADLRDQGVPRDEAITAVSQVFGIPRGAARLFVLSHPAWAEDEGRSTTSRWEL